MGKSNNSRSYLRLFIVSKNKKEQDLVRSSILDLTLVSTIASLLIIAAILTPSIIKLSHAIYEHKEQKCEIVGSLHVHEVELDCDFQKFKLSPQYHIILTGIEKLTAPVIKEKSFDLYSFISKYQKLHFALRGPPIV